MKTGINPTIVVPRRTGLPKLPHVARHVKVCATLRQRLAEGDFAVGHKLLTDKQVMREFGVGRTTARTAIETLVQEHLLSRIPGQGTFINNPEQVARAKDASNTRYPKYHVMIIYPDWANAHAGSDSGYMLASINNALTARGIKSSLLALPDVYESAQQVLKRSLETVKPDGIVMHTMTDERLYAMVEHLPSVATTLTLYSTLISVIPDFQEGIRKALDHLFEFGHHKIGLITEMLHSSPFVNLWVFNFEQKMYDRGNPIRREWLCMPRVIDELNTGIKTMMEGSDRPTAVVAVGPKAVINTYEVAESHGLRIPEDLSVVGYVHACEHLMLKPRLTNITYSIEELGEHSATAITTRLEGNMPELSIRQIPVNLVAGQSVVKPAKE
jgi:DNA-binding LacI/PurR family transcriptional regulator